MSSESIDQDVLYDRQQHPEPNHQDTICVIGTGGMGSWSSIITAMTGVSKCMILIDGDVIEESNLNRLPFKPEDVGRKKVNVLKEFINNIRPDLPVITFDEHFDQDLYERIDIEVDTYFFCAEGEAHQTVKDVLPQSEFDNTNVLFLAGDSREIQLRTYPIGFQSGTGTGDYDDVSALDTIGGGLSLVFNYLGINYPHPEISSTMEEHSIFTINPVKLQNKIQSKESEIDRLDDYLSEKKDLISKYRTDLREKEDELIKMQRKIDELQNDLAEKDEIIQELEQELRITSSFITELKELFLSFVDEFTEISVVSTSFVNIVYDKLKNFINPGGLSADNSWSEISEKRDIIIEFFDLDGDE